MSDPIVEQYPSADSRDTHANSSAPASLSRMAGSYHHYHHHHHHQQQGSSAVELMSINDSPSPPPNAGANPLVFVKSEDNNDDVMVIPDEEPPPARKDKGKGKAVEVDEPPKINENAHPIPPENLLSSYSCPICFSTVTNACLTPCGHVLCGLCLFSAVRSGIKRGLELGIPPGREGTTARYDRLIDGDVFLNDFGRCPVCRATLKGWDGKGGGVIPLKIRTITTL